MSISSQINRIQEDRNSLRNWTVTAGLTDSNADLDEITTAVTGIEIKGGVNAEVQEGQSVTIPKGYHDGSGVIKGVSGGGNYSLQSKTVTPTKSSQSITSDDGYYGLSSVSVGAIPEAYQDVTSVTAVAGDVLANKIIVDSTGKVTTGTMTNNGKVTQTLDASKQSYTIAKGYHDGTGSVKITPETKTVTPTEESRDVTPTSGKVLTKVTVNPIPSTYADASGVTVDASKMLDGVTAIGKDAEGNAVTVTGNIATTNTVFVQSGTITTNPQDVTKYRVGGSYSDGGKYLDSTGTATVNISKDAFGNAVSSNVLIGTTFSSGNGIKIDGSMTNNGDTTGQFDGLTTLSFSIPSGYTTGGTVTLTDDIEEALAAI